MTDNTNGCGRVIPFVQNGEYFFHRGLMYYKQKQLDKAKVNLLRAIKYNKEETSYLCQLATVLSELGEYSEANRWLHYVLTEIDPDVTECYFFMANNYARQGNFEQAEEAALYYLEVDADGDFVDEAEKLLAFIGTQTEISFQEATMIQKNERARDYMQRAEYEEAIAIFKQLISNYPTFWAAYNNLALAYFYMGNEEQAFATLDSLLTKNHGNFHALCNLALFYHYTGEKKRSQTFIEQLKQMYPLPLDFKYKLGSTFALVGEDEHAYQWLVQLANTLYREDVAFCHWLASAAYKTDRIEKAKYFWKLIIQLDPTGKVAPYYLKQLHEGTLSKEAINYQYRMPKRATTTYLDILAEELKQQEKVKLIHIYAVSDTLHDEGYKMLKRFCERSGEPLYFKQLAAYSMVKHRPDKAVLISEQNWERIYTKDSTFSKTITSSVQVILRLKASFVRDEFHDFIQELWVPIFKVASLRSLVFRNVEGWAAAVEYVWAQRKGIKLTQRIVANTYHISVSTVSNYTRKVRELLRSESV